jgi:chemotaxis protein MotB
MQQMPNWRSSSSILLIDQTPEGPAHPARRQEGRSMYEPGSAGPMSARACCCARRHVVNQLPNRITLSGHTSAAVSGRSEGDWTLSAARANSARQILETAGVDPDRVYQVSGKAASDPLYPDDPTLAGNRRIALVLLREAPVLPPDAGL